MGYIAHPGKARRGPERASSYAHLRFENQTAHPKERLGQCTSGLQASATPMRSAVSLAYYVASKREKILEKGRKVPPGRFRGTAGSSGKGRSIQKLPRSIPSTACPLSPISSGMNRSMPT